jgi:phage terminase large subunit-like protein
MPSREANFRNLILNQRVDATAQFLTASVWKACADNRLVTHVQHLRGRPCFAGLDLGSARDLSALVLVFADDDGAFDVVPFFWLPGDDLREREDTDRAPYVQWRNDGFLLTTPGKSTDPKAIALKIAELHGVYDFKALAYDRWRIEDLKRELDAIGTAPPLLPFGQGFRDMSPAIDTLERLVIDGKLRHGGNPLLDMCAANAVTRRDPAGNRKLDKEKSTGRIDGLVALAMALGATQKHEPPAKPVVSVYEELARLAGARR